MLMENFGELCNDCIALCAPNQLLDVIFLQETIFIRPKPDPKTRDDIALESHEVYDICVVPRTKPLDRLLLLSPHSLYKGTNESVLNIAGITLCNFTHFPIDGDICPYPKTPIVSGEQITVRVPAIQGAAPSATNTNEEGLKGRRLWGELGTPESLKILADKGILGVLEQTGHTIVEFRLNAQLPIGEKGWFRIKISPPEISDTNGIRHDDGGHSRRVPTSSQRLDIVSPSLMLQSFVEILDKIAEETEKADLTGQRTNEGLCISDIRRNCIECGFLARNTFTRIYDHRVMLVSEGCKIDPADKPDKQGSQESNHQQLDTYYWFSGLAERPEDDILSRIISLRAILSQNQPQSIDHLLTNWTVGSIGQERQLFSKMLEMLEKENLVKKTAEGVISLSLPNLDQIMELEANVNLTRKLFIDPAVEGWRGWNKITYTAVWEQETTEEAERRQKLDAANLAREQRNDKSYRLSQWGIFLAIASIILAIILYLLSK